MAEPSRTKLSAAEQGISAHVLVVEARFYDDVMDHLLGGAKAALEAAGSTYDVVTVPGALEIPAAVAILVEDDARRGTRAYEAVVALGCVIRGETYHFEIVANESARGLVELAVSRALPLGNAILTVETMEQALVRADPARGNKGGEAVEAALSLLRLKRSVATS